MFVELATLKIKFWHFFKPLQFWHMSCYYVNTQKMSAIKNKQFFKLYFFIHDRFRQFMCTKKQKKYSNVYSHKVTQLICERLLLICFIFGSCVYIPFEFVAASAIFWNASKYTEIA